ncbi:flagellar hook assembly protein FlgD [Dryocola sp. BD626]|uniref:flagellar hook assembly protein FlgD n=1 Tax=Dryocola sp. BD626 TaxID=3133273 RepID=UPI003F503E9B
MAVSPVSGNSGNGQVGTGSSAADLSESFMQLLIAQMQNQDPTNPMDNNQLTSQLAQFNTAAGVEKLNTSVTAVAWMMSTMQEMNAVNWVGRDVMIKGDPKVTWGADGTRSMDGELSFHQQGEADKVTVTFTDEAGNAYTAELKDTKTGVNNFSLDDLENFQPSEPEAGVEYKVTYSATNEGGDDPVFTGLIKDKVEGVSMTQEGAVLHLASGETTTISDVFLLQ